MSTYVLPLSALGHTCLAASWPRLAVAVHGDEDARQSTPEEDPHRSPDRCWTHDQIESEDE
jgi:hypothetical protein